MQSSCIITVSAPSGIGAPVKMRIASPRRNRPAERMAGGGAARHGQYGLPIREQIGMGDRKTVDGAVGVRRHVDPGDQIARQDAPGSSGKRHGLRLDDRRDPLLDQRERGVDAEQRAAERKAIVAQLGHFVEAADDREMNAATAAGSPSGSSGTGAANGSSEATATIHGSSG